MAFSAEFIVLTPRWWLAPLCIAIASYFDWVGEDVPAAVVGWIADHGFVLGYA